MCKYNCKIVSNGILLLALMFMLSLNLNGQKNSIYVTGGSALFLNTSVSLAYQRKLIDKASFMLCAEVNYGVRTPIVTVQDQEETSFNYRSISVSYSPLISNNKYLELSVGVSNIVEHDNAKNVKLNYNRSYFAIGVLWDFEKINLRVGVSNQKMLYFGFGFNF